VWLCLLKPPPYTVSAISSLICGPENWRKSGVKLRLQDQPYEVLLKLLEHHGEIVSREELRSTLWHEDTFVDFETGLNTAVKRLRETLGDSADNPTFIETVPRRGYRCIVPVKFLTDASKIALPLSSTTPFQRRELESSPFPTAVLALWSNSVPEVGNTARPNDHLVCAARLPRLEIHGRLSGEMGAKPIFYRIVMYLPLDVLACLPYLHRSGEL